MKRKMNQSLSLILISLLSVSLLFGTLVMNGFAGMISPSKDCVAEIYQLAPESSSLVESYVIKTPNGKLIVIDGGIDGAGENVGVSAKPYLTSALRAIAGVGEGEHFTVDAWFVSHAHADHYLELAKMLCAYTGNSKYKGETMTMSDGTKQTWTAKADKNFTIKNFYFDFPEEGEWPATTETQSGSNFHIYLGKFKEGLAKYAAANNIKVKKTYYDDLNGKVVNEKSVKKGLTITIDGIDFQILQTWSASDSQVNDNSMVIRMVNGEQSALFLNDTSVKGGNRLLTTQGAEALKSDIVQLGHHGQNGCSKEFYDAIEAQNSVRLWACPYGVWKGESSAYQTKEVRTWFGLEEDAELYAESRTDFVASLYGEYPADRTSVSDWAKVIDNMKITLPLSYSYRTARQFDILESAAVRVGTKDGVEGIRFTAIMAKADEEAEYGFVIVPKKYVDAVKSQKGFDGDYIKALTAKYGKKGILKMYSRPVDMGTYFKISGSVGNIKFENMKTDYTPIAFMYKNGKYVYASYSSVDNISANLFELSTRAYNQYPDGKYADTYKGFVDDAINLTNGNPAGTKVESYKLAFDKEAMTLLFGETKQLVLDTDFIKDTVMLDYDNDVISYDAETGKIKAIRCGETTITAKCMTVEASVKITSTLPLEEGYLAMFDRKEYTKLTRTSELPARNAASVSATMKDSYTDANGVTETNVMKITTVANGSSAIADFVIDLPKVVKSSNVTVRILVKESDAKFIGFHNIENGALKYSAPLMTSGQTLSTDKKDVWMNVSLDYSTTDADCMNRLGLLVQGGTTGKTHTFYIAYVVDPNVLGDILATDLPNGYLADFSSPMYENLVRTNDFANRSAGSVSAVKKASYTDKNGVTETNVMEITTVGNPKSNVAVADFIMNMPKHANAKATVRILIKQSDATFIGFQNVEGGKQAYCGISGLITSGKVLSQDKLDVWMNVPLDYTDTDEEYLNRLMLLVQGGAKGGTHTFYLSYVVDTEEVGNILATELADGYLADFSSPMYENLVSGNDFASRNAGSVSAVKKASYTDKNGVTETNVMEITTVGNVSSSAAVADFIMNMPRNVSSKATVRILIKQSDATFIGFQNVEGGKQAYCGVSGLITAGAVLCAEKTDVWMNVPLDYADTDEGYWNRLMLLVQGGAKGGTHTFYLAYVVETDAIQNSLVAELPEGYLADFSSALYTNMVSTTAKTSQVMWLSEFAGEEGVLKVTATVAGTSSVSNKYAPIVIELPKNHSGSYKLKVYISDNTNFNMVGSASSANAFTSSKGGWLSANPPAKGQWKEYTVTQAENDGYENKKINILGYERTSEERTLEIYLAWVKN